jgi:Xaa-Pro aminopeptidase
MQAKIKSYLEEQSLDGLLFIGDSVCDSDMYYISHFFTSDRFTLLAPAEKVTLLVSSMEQGRAVQESCADRVVGTSDYGIKEKLNALVNPGQAYNAVLEEFLDDNKINRLGVSQRFPASIFCSLSKKFQVSIVESPVSRWREVKNKQEIEAITVVQRACEKSMRQAINLISKSEPHGRYLKWEGQPLTSEMVRSTIEIALLMEGCEAVDTIVAGGMDAVNPHARGSGPLPANVPIVIDIFPRSKRTRYFADMTRSVVRGEADPEIVDLYDAVLDAQSAGIGAVRAGSNGKEVHSRVCQVFADHGYTEMEGRGFIHSTGHGVGLEIHERPSLSEAGDVLEAGSVVTVEPGLYYPNLGAVRLEDLVVVRSDGCDNLTRFEKKLIL